MRHVFTRAIQAAVVGVAAFTGSAYAQEITGAGATFPAPLYSKWAAEYKKATGATVNYQSIGSGAGIKQIQAKTVTFGATDAPLKPEDLEKSSLVQFPTVIGGVVPIVNLDGVKAGDITLDGPTLAKIYLGEIKTWNDPAIAKLNPSAKLPATAIVTVQRSDGSGTNFLFTDYLSKVSADFKSKVGANTAVSWPVGVGAKGNEGIAAQVKQTVGAIGYVEYIYAKQNKLAYTKLVNAAGKAVTPEKNAFQAAAGSVKWESTPGYYAILTNQGGDATWPITGATFILMQKQPTDAKASAEAVKFFRWAYKDGDKFADELDYIPMPDSAVKAIENTLSSDIKS
jgi:phosphate transport system substrate-binding protein